MSDQLPESALGLPASGVMGAARQPLPSCLVEELVSLFDQLQDRLLRYVISFGLPIQDAEDIVQEAFLALFSHLQQGRSRRDLRAWTFRVAHNQALKRRGQRRVQIQKTTDDPALLLALQPDNFPSPEDQAAISQRQHRVLAVLNALPEQDRQCLTLRIEGLRYREISAVLDLSLGAVSVSLTRSLTRLARSIQW